MLVEKQKSMVRTELLRGKRRALLSFSIDPVLEPEFEGRLSFDALGHVYARSPDCREAQTVGRGLAIPSRQPALCREIRW